MSNPTPLSKEDHLAYMETVEKTTHEQQMKSESMPMLMGLDFCKKWALNKIKLKATEVRAIVTQHADPIYLLGLANKADIGRAILSDTATDFDKVVINEELQQRIALKLSPKTYTVEKLATEQVARQAELVKLANFVEYFEKSAIAQISALDDGDAIQTALEALNSQANIEIKKLTEGK